MHSWADTTPSGNCLGKALICCNTRSHFTHPPRSSWHAKLGNFQVIYDAHRLWKTGLRKVQRECAKHKDSKYEGKADLEEMSCLLEGGTRTLYEIYERNGAEFREAVCVWGIWINEGLSRTHPP